MSKYDLSPPLTAWKKKGKFRKLLGHNMFFIDDGESGKPVLLLIHGFPTSTWDWQPVWQDLSEHYRLVAMDMLGFGFSDKPNERTYTIHGQADLFEALVHHLRIKNYHILAHDYGDSVAQELLARHSDRKARGNCLSCCFLNGGLFPETHRALLIQKLILSPLGPYINKFTGLNQFSRSFSKVFGKNTKPTELELKQFWEVINYKDGKHLFHNLITYIDDRREHRSRWVKVLQKSKIPLSLINGSADPVSGRHMVARYKELKCRLDHCVELPDVGHYPQVEAPRQVAEAYLSFLAEFGQT